MSQGPRPPRPPAHRRSRSNPTPANVGPPPRLCIPDEPPKVPRRPPSKGNKRETLADIAKRIPIQLMRQYFNYPLRSAAEAMHISVTTLKRLCRRHGVKRWPHRQISGINRALNDLEAQHQVASEGELAAVADQLRQLHRRREVIIELAFESDDETSCKSFPDGSALASHKRGSTTSESSSSSSSLSSSISSSPRARSGSIVSAPESPNSATSLDDNTPTSVWWQHTPLVADDRPDPAPVEESKARMDAIARSSSKTLNGSSSGKVSGSGRPRQPPSSKGSKAPPRTQRSAMFGNIPRPGRATGASSSQYRRKVSVGNKPSKDSMRRSSPCAPPSSSAPAPRPPSPVNVVMAPDTVVPGGAAEGGDVLSSHQLSAAAVSAGRSGGSMFDQTMQVTQQMDDLAALGELLFGPDETAAAAAAESRGHGLFASSYAGGGVFSPIAPPWSPSCVPFCPPGVFSHEFSSFAAGGPPPSTFSSHELAFSNGLASASNWGGLGGDRNGLGAPTGSVGPLQ